MFFGVVQSPAAPVESASGTIYILLGTQGDDPVKTNIWEKTAFKNYVQNNIVSDTALVYCSFYDMSQGTPAEFAQEYLSRTSGKSIFESALVKWYSEGSSSELKKLKKKYKNLDSLKNARPDVVPSRFVVIADGAAGLAVREYIQGPDYRGDISNVVFFNTPHEGTGLADQAVFKGTDRLDRGADYTKYATLVTLALAAYIVGGTDGLQDMMIGLLKDAVMGMAMSVGDVSKDLSSLYDGYSASNAATWYLTQDASVSDDKYVGLVPSGMSEHLGGTQLLNAGAVGNGFSHPAYNIVYSYGLPSVGNGRRTLSDFAEQSKFHVSKEKLVHVLADSLKSAFGASAQENLDDLAEEIMENGNVRAALASYSQYSGYAADAARVLAAVSELRRSGSNKDDIPGTIYNLLRIVDTFVPDSYKSEIYSLLMKYFSPEVRDAIGNAGKCAVGGGSVSGCAKEGMALMAANLANYSLNFFDEGSFDVPYYSAMGANVSAFREANRYGYGFQDILKKKSAYTAQYSSYASDLSSLEKYRDLLSDVGELETDRQVVDLALNVACEIVTRANAAYGKICSAAEFATNVALVGLTSAKVKKLAKNSKNLKVTHDLSLMATLVDSVSYEGLDYHGKKFSGSIPDIGSMLFGTPSISIASVRRLDGTDTVVVPLVAKQQCTSGEVFSWKSFNSLCADSGWLKMPLSSFDGFRGGNENITVKDVAYGPGGEKSVRYANLGKLEASDYMEEIRFQVDDLQPDSLRWFKLDFNTRIQIIYERKSSGQWYVYFEESYKKGEPVDTLVVSPVTKNGLFVFRPQDIIDKYNDIHKNDPSFNSYEMGGLMEDGANIIYIAVMNKVGKLTSAKFPFFFKATDFNASAVWPMDFARISHLGTVSVKVNNEGYDQYELTSVGVKVSRSGKDSVCSDSVSARFYRIPAESNSTANYWKASASLDSVVSQFSCPVDGEYVLEWTFEMRNSSGSTESFGLKSLVFVDATPPVLELNVPKKVLSGSSSDGVWGAVVYPDSSFEPIRGIRGMLVDALGHVFTLFQKTRHNAKSVDIRWPSSRPAPGPYLLVVQAFDFADPDSVSSDSLLNISDSDTSAWLFVTDSTGFKQGFNGTILSDSIWIDNVAPSVVPDSIVTGSVRDTTASGCDSSKISRSGFVLNSCNLISTSFRVHEELYGRKSSGVKVEVVFRDSRNSLGRGYLGSLDTNIIETRYHFVEPEANRLADGVYSVHAVLTDAAGNVSETKLADSIIVDRTAPSVYDVSSGGVSFDSVPVLVGKGMSALVSQNMDDSRNVSTLSCVRSLDAAGTITGWKPADTLAFVTGVTEGKLSFSIDDLVRGMPNGSWTVYIGCYDAAGNFGSGLDFFGMGARYPRITYPTNSLNEFYYGKVLVKGETPNPIVGGDGNKVSFKLAWKDTAWHVDEGFEYLAHGVGEKERDLAIWTLDSSSYNADSLKLSVRACDTCAWASSVIGVTVYSKLDPLHDTTETNIKIDAPKQQVPGVVDTIAIELEHVSDTTSWKVKSTVTMFIAGDTSSVEASSHTFDPAIVSPFKIVPSSIDSGLYVWQDSGAWHVYWKGDVEGVVIDSAYLAQKRLPGNDTLQVPSGAKRHPPRLTLRFLADSLDKRSSDSLFALAVEDSAAMGSVEAGGILVPAYDRSVTWALDSLAGDSLHLVFASGSAFTVDVSTVDSAYRNVYCGNRTADEALPDYGGAGVVYVYPQRYKMNHVWSGQNDGGIYADGDSACVKVVAYSKVDPSRIVTNEKCWNLLHDATKLVAGTTVPGELYVGLDFSDTNAVMFGGIAFRYGLHGRAAYVKEEVIGPNGFEKSLRTKFVYAGASNMANMVSWDGREAGTNFGKYMFRLTAYSDAAGTTALDTLEYEFDVKSRENLREDTTVVSSSMGYPAVLTVDEAHLDSFGDLRYVGSIDYLMKAHASMNYLPEENRTFRYKWEPWTNNNGIARQAPAFYKKYRYSVGIRRHRDRFPVTVAVLLMAEGINVKHNERGLGECIFTVGQNCDDYCTDEGTGYPYKIKVFRAVMLEHGNGTASFSTDLTLDPDMKIVGHWNHGEPVSSYGHSVYNMGAAVKILPIDVFPMIVTDFGDSEVTGHAENDVMSGKKISSWRKIWEDTLYNEQKKMGRWFNNWNGLPVLWEGKRETFHYKDYSAHLSDVSQEGSSPCSVDTSLIDSSVCGLSREDEGNVVKLKSALESYNPHAGMMGVDIGPMLPDDYGIGKYNVNNSCSGYNGSFSNIGINLRFVVRSNYWHPQWGYNNLANRYVRFDPTNKTLFGDKGYFKSNREDFDANKISSADTARFKNHFGSNGWEYSYNMSDARISAFEAERFPMRQTGMNPLVFSDEIDTSTSLIPSMFSVTFFSAGMKPNFQVAACNKLKCNSMYSSNHAAMYEQWRTPSGKYDSTRYDDSPNIYFVVAPVMTPDEAIIQNENDIWVPYPYAGPLDTNLFEGTRFADTSYSLVYYPDLRSRIHVGAGDWDDNYWDSVYVSNYGFVKNPATDMGNLFMSTPAYLIPNRNDLDSLYSYSMKLSDTAAGLWSINQDSLKSVTPGIFRHGSVNGMIMGKFRPVEVDSLGNRIQNPRWIVDTSSGMTTWNITTGGDTLTPVLDYVFSADSTIAMDFETRKHSVPLANVFRQNGIDSLLGNPWTKNLNVALDSLLERDTLHADTMLSKHPLLWASYDSAGYKFNVTWNGMAPTSRATEIATFRGRVPGANAPWKLSYEHDGYTYPVASGVQDSMPLAEPFPVLTRFNMSHLQGPVTFFLTWGSDGFMNYRKLDLHVGSRVDPDSFAYVQAAYANAGVEFAAGAWGDDTVDVTVRSVAPEEYVFKTFKGLAVQGPVVEVLPSHDFGDVDSLWPVVKVKLSRNDVRNSGHDLDELKIYKPDFENREIVPLENVSYECFVEVSGGVDTRDSCSNTTWDYVFLKGTTRTFSTFVVLDTLTAKSVVPSVPPSVPDTLICAEPASDTVWAGTYNGRLEFANPCTGRANYLLQLRVGGSVAAEHQGVLSGPAIAWEARRGDIWLPADVYTSRADYYGVDGSTERVRGPMVRVDSMPPSLTDFDVSVLDGDSGSRVLLVSASLADSISGIANVVMDVRFGGYLAETRTLSLGSIADTALYEQFVLSPVLLHHCTGCRATVDVRIEDLGHNYVEESWRSRQLYPFPSSLALWYPMSEGSGNVAHEMLAGLNLSLDSVNTPWVYGGRLSLFGLRDRSTTSNNLHADSVTPMSVEFDAIVGKRSGAVFTWHDDSTTLTLGIENGKFYVKVDSGTVELSYYVSSDVPEHCVFVFDTSFVTLYVDGNFVERVALPGDFVMRDNGKPILGYYFGEQSAYFRMSNLRVYRSALTAEQVQFLQNLDSLPPYREPGDSSAVDTSVVDSIPVSLAVRAVGLDSAPGLVVDQSCALPGRSYLRQGSGTSGKAVWNVDAPRAGNYALYVFGRGYSSANSRVDVSVNGVDVGTYGLRPSGLWESSRIGDSLLVSLDSGMNRIELRPLGGAEIAGVAALSSLNLPEAHLVDFGQSGWAAPEPSVEAFIYYENAYETTWARPRIKLHNLTGQYIYGARIRYYYSGEGSAVAATSWYPEGPASVVHDAGDVYYAEYVLAEPIPPHGFANNGSAIQLGLHRTPDFKAWKIQDDPSYEHGSAYGYVEAKGVAVLDSRGEMLTGWNCVDDGMPATTPASGIRALAAEESNEPWKNSTIAVSVENNGSDSISGFEVRYYYRDASGTMEPPDWYYLGPDTASATPSKVAAGGNLYYVSLVYNNVVLKPGKRSASVKFGLHARGWSESAYSVSDDPSHHGIGTGKNLLEADSVVVLDRNGNLLWGNVPRPNFQNNVVASDPGSSRVTRVGDVVYVNVDQTGYYYLEVVDAFGTVKNRLFEGTWTAGEHTVQIPASAMQPGRYIVLRRGNTILNWQLLK
jgi:hypothetical protein